MAFYRKRVFPVLAGLLWLAFLTLDLTGAGSSTWVKFAAICLCCVTALAGAKTADGQVVAAALCFTVAADWFLLVRNDHYGVGVGLFIVVQALYAYRLYRLRGNQYSKRGLPLRLISLLLPLYHILSLIIYGSIFMVLAMRWRFAPDPDVLQSLAFILPPDGISYLIFPLFYFFNLCLNTAEAFTLKKSLFAWGLALFVCCDICVGACNLGLATAFTWWGSWLFYLPSQVLIVLSQE